MTRHLLDALGANQRPDVSLQEFLRHRVELGRVVRWRHFRDDGERLEHAERAQLGAEQRGVALRGRERRPGGAREIDGDQHASDLSRCAGGDEHGGLGGTGHAEARAAAEPAPEGRVVFSAQNHELGVPARHHLFEHGGRRPQVHDELVEELRGHLVSQGFPHRVPCFVAESAPVATEFGRLERRERVTSRVDQLAARAGPLRGARGERCRPRRLRRGIHADHDGVP